MTAKLDAIGLVVADLEAAIDFYRHLGLDFGDPADPDGHGHAEAALAGGMRLMLDSIKSVQEFDPAYKPASGDPRVSLAFRCPSPSGVDEMYANLLNAGATSHKEPWDAFWGQRYAQVRDLDGNGVDLYAPI
jgi:uncharacterized glyoxalase superfamily protein PhnB